MFSPKKRSRISVYNKAVTWRADNPERTVSGKEPIQIMLFSDGRLFLLTRLSFSAVTTVKDPVEGKRIHAAIAFICGARCVAQENEIKLSQCGLMICLRKRSHDNGT